MSSCTDSCDILRKIIEDGLPRVNGACTAFENAVNASEVTARALNEMIVLYSASLHKVSLLETYLLQLQKDNEQYENSLKIMHDDKLKLIELLKRYSDEGKVFDIYSFLDNNISTVH
jgi:hypothetical protein